MNGDPEVEKIFAAFAELRRAAADGPATRKHLDTLFRSVHNFKANASARGLSDLAAAAHEFENVLHALRTGKAVGSSDELVTDGTPFDFWGTLKQDEKHALKQSLAEGATLFLVQTSFEVADFDLQFQELKAALSETGEVISTSPRVDNEHPGRVDFRILYARTGGSSQPLALEFSDVTIEEISRASATFSLADPGVDQATLELSFEKFSAAVANRRAPPVESFLTRVLRAGRAAARATGKDVDFEVHGEEIFENNSLAETIADPLIHLIRNAVDHGIESRHERAKLGKPERGRIVVAATRNDSQTIVTVTDDGRGVDPALISEGLLFSPGFSTATEVSELSGRGVGLDVVQTTIQQAGGSVRLSSRPGEGSTFEITIPNPELG